MKPVLEASREPKPREGPSLILQGELIIPSGAKGIVLFAHGSGSSRHSPRNQQVARMLRKAGLGTLLFDLLTAEEEEQDMKSRHLRFDIERLAARLLNATNSIMAKAETKHLRIGYLGSSTGAGAALLTAAQLGDKVGAIVSHGGRPDLAGSALPQVKAPTLLIVGQKDEVVLGLNQQAFAKLRCAKETQIIPRATHLFEEPGALDEAARYAANWFDRYLQR